MFESYFAKCPRCKKAYVAGTSKTLKEKIMCKFCWKNFILKDNLIDKESFKQNHNNKIGR
jgi:hypothetical protein